MAQKLLFYDQWDKSPDSELYRQTTHEVNVPDILFSRIWFAEKNNNKQTNKKTPDLWLLRVKTSYSLFTWYAITLLR